MPSPTYIYKLSFFNAPSPKVELNLAQGEGLVGKRKYIFYHHPILLPTRLESKHWEKVHRYKYQYRLNRMRAEASNLSVA